jgi:hypothetical protein
MQQIKAYSSRTLQWLLANSSVRRLSALLAPLMSGMLELGVDRDDTGFARLVKKAAEEGKPLDKTSMPNGGGCPFAGTGSRGREAKL